MTVKVLLLNAVKFCLCYLVAVEFFAFVVVLVSVRPFFGYLLSFFGNECFSVCVSALTHLGTLLKNLNASCLVCGECLQKVLVLSSLSCSHTLVYLLSV